MNQLLHAHWLPLMGFVTLRSTLLLLLAAGLAFLVRRHPEMRHRIGVLTCLGLLLLPVLSGMHSPWQVAVPLRRTVAPPSPAPLPRSSLSSPIEKSALLEPSVAPSLTVPLQVVPPLRASTPASSINAWSARVPQLLFGVWLVGMGLVLMGVLASFAALQRLQAQGSQRVDAGPLAEQCAQLAAELGLGRTVALRIATSPAACVPMTWGCLRPTVLLPCEAPTWDKGQLRSALLHELSHIQRKDWAAQCLATLVCALYWFHPLVWLAVSRLRTDAERATDERVVAQGVKASDYCTHLLALAHAAAGGASRSYLSSSYARCGIPGGIPMARGTRIESRVRTLLAAPSSRHGLTRLSTFLLLGSLGLAFVMVATLQFAARAVPLASRNAPQLLSEASNWADLHTQIAQLKSQQRQLHAKAVKTPANRAKDLESLDAQIKQLEQQINVLQNVQAYSLKHGLANLNFVEPSYTTKLPDGSTVSLLGVSDPGAGNKQWWTPSGQPLANNAFIVKAGRKATPKHKLRQFVALVHRAYPYSEDWEWSADPFLFWGGHAFYGNRKPSYAEHGDLMGLTALIPQGRAQASLKLKFMFLPWRTLVENKKDTVLSRLVEGYQVLFNPSTEFHGNDFGINVMVSDGSIRVNSGMGASSIKDKESDSTAVTISHTIFNQNVRVVAVDVAGQEHTALSSYSIENKKFNQLTSLFKGLPLSRVRAFRVQVQPVCTITFPDIHLEPQPH